MGKILQIQVRAWTYDENEVTAAWPKLSGLVWNTSAKWAPAGQKHGVMELVEALPDVTQYGDLPPEQKSVLKQHNPQIQELAGKLKQALADWQPQVANQYSDHLEDALTDLENSLPAA